MTAREEERRRLRRDLHDGVGAALAGVRLQVETARDLVTEPVASGLLESAATGVATAVDDVRAITDDLRPAVLDDLGLAGSLRGLARPDGHAGHRDRRATSTWTAPLPAAVEVACYRIAAEALANAVRHAGRPPGRRCTLARRRHGPVARRSRTTASVCPERPRADGLGPGVDAPARRGDRRPA